MPGVRMNLTEKSHKITWTATQFSSMKVSQQTPLQNLSNSYILKMSAKTWARNWLDLGVTNCCSTAGGSSHKSWSTLFRSETGQMRTNFYSSVISMWLCARSDNLCSCMRSLLWRRFFSIQDRTHKPTTLEASVTSACLITEAHTLMWPSALKSTRANIQLAKCIKWTMAKRT